VCIALCTIVAHNIAQNRPDNFPPYPPDNHHNSDDVYLREGGVPIRELPQGVSGFGRGGWGSRPQIDRLRLLESFSRFS